MARAYFVCHVYFYNDGSKRKNTYLYKTLNEAMEKVMEVVAEETDVDDWDSTGPEDVIVDLFGTTKEYNVGIRIESAEMMEEP